MPSRAKRVAARQTQLGQRKRKERARGGIPQQMEGGTAKTSPTESEQASALPTVSLNLEISSVQIPSKSPEIQRARTYLVRELRRIAFFSGLILAMLGGLTVLLAS